MMSEQMHPAGKRGGVGRRDGPSPQAAQPVPLLQLVARDHRLAVLMYVRFPLSLRNVEDLLAHRGIDVSYETVRFWWNRFGPMFAAEIRRKRVDRMRAYTHWRWHLDEVYVRINGGAALPLAGGGPRG